MKSLLLAAALVSTVAPAAAQDVRFQGQSYGCFGIGCTPTSSAGVNFLNYTGTSFDQTTSNGNATLQFGYFTWDAFQGVSWVNSPFSLFLSFTMPTGIAPSPVYGSNVYGLIIHGTFFQHAINLSTTVLVFQPNVKTFSFTGGQPNQAGNFTLTVNDLYISSGQTALKGYVTNAATGPIVTPPPPTTTVTPEPMTVLLLGSGMAGLAVARRRRKQGSAA